MSSQTKYDIVNRHNQNRLLQSHTPPIMMRDGTDASADELSAPLDARIIGATVEALEAGQTHYVPVPGIDLLREAIAAYLNATTGTHLQPANVLVTAGMQEARFLTHQKIGEEYDHIALPAIVHPGVRMAWGVRPLRLRTIAVEAAGNMLPALPAIRQALIEDSRLLFLESPSRLTGAIYSAEEVAAIYALAIEFDAAIIWDQGLAPWVNEPAYASLAAQEQSAARVATIGEAWPGMGLASWFLGYITAPETWLPAIQSQKQIMSICTSTPTQFAGLEASRLHAEIYPEQLSRLRAARASLLGQLANANLTAIEGAAANVLAIRLPAQNAAQIGAALAQAGYRVADGTDFGAPDVLRLSVTIDSAAATTLAQLARILDRGAGS